MNENVLNILMIIGVTIIISVLCCSLDNTRKERDKYYKTTCILSDCCRNMIDNYEDPDSIYINYINIAVEEGIDEEEFTNLSYCY